MKWLFSVSFPELSKRVDAGKFQIEIKSWAAEVNVRRTKTCGQ
jgi:hypothetical protein